MATAKSKVSRNDPCPCGSGKKFKHCCEKKKQGLGAAGWVVIVVVGVAAVLVGLLVARSLTGGSAGSRCPPGQVWSPDHGHCH